MTQGDRIDKLVRTRRPLQPRSQLRILSRLLMGWSECLLVGTDAFDRSASHRPRRSAASATRFPPTATPFLSTADNPISIAEQPFPTALLRKPVVFKFRPTAETRLTTAKPRFSTSQSRNSTAIPDFSMFSNSPSTATLCFSTAQPCFPPKPLGLRIFQLHPPSPSVPPPRSLCELCATAVHSSPSPLSYPHDLPTPPTNFRAPIRKFL